MTKGGLVTRCLTHSKDWREALSAIRHYDFVHTYDFHKASEAIGEGTPIAFTASNENGLTAFWPLLKRAIPGSDRCDLGCVYGYGGPLFASGRGNDETIEALMGAMRREGAIAVFSRMHPLFVDQITNESNRGVHVGDVVVIDLDTDDQPPSGYRGSHRREIAQIERKGVHVEIRSDAAALDVFQRIYEGQMAALGANQYYYFDRAYYEALLSAQDFKAEIFIAMADGRPAAASMFVTTTDVMQYFLSGTDAEFRKLAPTKLLIAYAHREAARRNLRKLVLGGGVGGQRDALFKFKQGFSSQVRPFHVVKEVIDPVGYDDLCRKHGSDPSRVSFFPAYRA